MKNYLHFPVKAIWEHCDVGAKVDLEGRFAYGEPVEGNVILLGELVDYGFHGTR